MSRYPVLILAILLSACTSQAQLRLSSLLNDNMVLQRNTPVNIWGWAKPKAKVEVAFLGQQKSTKAAKDGTWMITLPAMKAGGPHTMSVSSKKEQINIDNILIGDVWLCSGQSNMEWSVQNSNNPVEEIAAADHPTIRHFKVPRAGAPLPQDTLPGGEWEVCSPETVGDFTAVGYYFARELQKHQDVPIGLLNSSWGGSRIEPWMSAQTLGYKSPEESSKKILPGNESTMEEGKKKMKALFGNLPTGSDAGMKGTTPIWADPVYSTGSWPSMKIPGLWEGVDGLANLDGVIWYEKTFELTEAQTKEDVTVHLGPIDDDDQTYLNGHFLGEKLNAWNEEREYICHKEYLKKGKNVLRIRVTDHTGGGGLYGSPDAYFIQTADGKISLAGEWRYMLGRYDERNYSARTNQTETLLYHAMIYPALKYKIKGALWYQGESNAGSMEDATEYRHLFKDMIQQWRKDWNSGEFPFLFVQLANFKKARAQPENTSWAMLRESQSKALELPNTAQAVIIDIGEAEDIHPRNKQDVGLRLSLAARKLAYGEEVVYSGPVYQSMETKNNGIELTFGHAGSGLTAKRDQYGYLKGFAIAGEDKKFVWAKALIINGKVFVWNEAVENPVAVRYAWGDNPDDANLYNEEGLPASPFRTDEW